MLLHRLFGGYGSLLPFFFYVTGGYLNLQSSLRHGQMHNSLHIAALHLTMAAREEKTLMVG